MITATPVIRHPLASMPAPGYTDFCNIYIASELNADEYRTILRHEQAHVWAGHNRRKPTGCVDKCWKVACELEIARNIYDDDDITAIIAQRSRLTGAYLPNTIPDLPIDLILAEDIYEWLINQPQSTDETREVCCTHCTDVSDPASAGPIVPIGEIRDVLDAEEVRAKSEVATVHAYKALRNRPPLLTDCIDAALRYRVVGESSYRRPSRREAPDYIAKGRISTLRPPLVEIYIDRSGSFTYEKTSVAESTLRTLLQRYHASIRYDVWFFGNGKIASTDLGGGGDTPYYLVAKQISESRPKLAIIITDDDPVGDISKPSVEILCIPIGCARTKLSSVIGGKDVAAVCA